MALYDSADLLQRLTDLLGRPSTDAVFTPTYKYRLLTQAEGEIKPMIATHCPHAMWSAPAQMTTSDNKVYTLAGGVTEPIKLLVLESLTGRPLKPGPFWDPESDYVWEGGNTIRITAGRERTFAAGPYARVITPPTTIDANTGSTIEPDRLRILLVYKAASLAARRGYGTFEPQYFDDLFDEAAWGIPGTGHVGLIGALKKTDVRGGLASIEGGGIFPYWRPE